MLVGNLCKNSFQVKKLIVKLLENFRVFRLYSCDQ